MSMFLPEQMQQPQLGVTPTASGGADTSDGDIALMQRVLSAASRNPNLIPADFMAYVVDFIQTSRLDVSIGQVFGFLQFTAHLENLAGVTDATSSVAAVDPPTHGSFQMTGLSDGSYLVLIAGDIKVAAAGVTTGRVILYANGVSSGSEIITGNTEFLSACSPAIVTLATGGSNTLALKMSSDDGATAVTLGYRAIVALKTANR